MIRNLKVLGLALVAVFAMAAMSASAASAANGKLTSTGPVTLDGTELAETGDTNALTAFGQTVECPGTEFFGHKYNVTPHELIPNGAETVTITPTYDNCHTVAGNKATVHMNECDFVLHIGETTGTGDTYGVSADLVCPAGHEVDLEIFLSANNENTKLCTVTLGTTGGHNQGLTGPHLTDETNGHVRITGTFEKVTAVESGLCGSSETTEGKYDVAMTFTGTNNFKESTAISLSHN